MKCSPLILAAVGLALTTTACATPAPTFPMACDTVIPGVDNATFDVDGDEIEFAAWVDTQITPLSYSGATVGLWFDGQGRQVGFSYAEDGAICTFVPTLTIIGSPAAATTVTP